MPETYHNPAPHEVIAGPVTLYVAGLDVEFPDVGEEPGEGWTKLGKRGSRSYDEEGVTIALPQTTQAWTGLGSTYARKIFRLTEEARVRLTLRDVSLEAYAHALGNEVVSAGGVKSIDIKRGFTVPLYKVIVVGPSAEGDGLIRHIRMNMAAQVGEVENVYVKGVPVGISLEYQALEDDDGDVGEIVDEEPAT